jgi:Ca-activated chloride channel homolog
MASLWGGGQSKGLFYPRQRLAGRFSAGNQEFKKTMRKFAALILLAALFAAPAEVLFGQTRPRRVGQTTTAATTPAPRPSSSSPAPTTRPTSPPTATKTRPSAGRPEASSGQRLPEEVAEEVGEDEVVRVNTALVTIPVSVLDRDGRFIPNLRKEDFRIFEDGTEQEVGYFATVEQPFTVALVIDTSNSTRFKLEDIQDAAIAFLDQLRPEDKVLVVSFSDEIRVLSEATNDRRQLYDAIRRTRWGGGTKLYDAVDMVVKQRLEHVKGRKAVVLFTDGVDTTSRRASYQSTLGDVEELDAMIYPIQYDTTNGQTGGGVANWPAPRRNPNGGGGGGGNRRRNTGWGDILGQIILGGGGGGNTGGGGTSSAEEYQLASNYLQQLAKLTGGRHHQADDLRNVEQAFTNIAEELRRQYSLGYYPSRTSQAAERRQLKVRVRRPNLVVRARDSYLYRPTGDGNNNATTAQQDDAANSQQQPPVLRRRNFNDTERGALRER